MYKVPFKVDLSKKVIAITGAGGIICGEFARALAACGAKVALLDINYEAAKKVADEIGENAFAVKCNCLDKEDIKAVKAAVNAKFGAVNYLINGAGGNNPKATCENEYMFPETTGVKDFFALDESGLKFVFDLNITSAFLVTQVFAADMVKTGGNIVNISSMNAYRPLTKIPAYSVAKAGVSNFTEWLAVHFAPCGIRCNAIAPGFFVTNQNRGLLFNQDGTPTARTGKILAATPMKKFGEISDRVLTVAFGRIGKRIRNGNGDPGRRRILGVQRSVNDESVLRRRVPFRKRNGDENLRKNQRLADYRLSLSFRRKSDKGR